MTPYFDLTVLWYPNYYLVSPFFIHLEYKENHTYLLAFTITLLLCLNYLKVSNKNKILPFKNFDWLTKITRILDRGVYLESPNEYLIFLLLLYLSYQHDPAEGQNKIKNHFTLFRQRAANFPIEQTLCKDAYIINYVYQKMESQGNIAYLWENKIIMILEYL